jgi:minor extracellular serine protease Vpr
MSTTTNHAEAGFRRKPPLRLALVWLLLLLAVSLVPGASATPPPDVVAGWSSQWFVELASAPSSDGTNQATLTAEHDQFAAAARAAGVSYRQRYAYRTLFNGVSISTSEDRISEIRNLDGVKAVYPVQTTSLDERVAVDPDAFEPDLAFAIAMTGADVVHSQLGYTGRGVHVAVMDTGIDYDHPDLGGCFGTGCRVTTGYDFVGDDYDADESDPRWQPVPHPDPLPDDCLGHGTHVAGIVGAKGAVTGVAPGVTFGSYRVFGCNDGTSTDVILAAMERIYRDGADVLNMSISEDLNSWPESPAAQAASRLVRKGIVVVGAAGNDRLDGLWAAGAPGVGEDVIATASVDNLKVLLPGFTISPDDLAIAYVLGGGSPAVPIAGTFAIARTGTVTTADDACNPLPAGSLAGKVALVRRGTCPFVVKEANVAAAGALALILYNNAGGRVSVEAHGSPIPVVFIAQEDGELINSRLDGGPVSMRWGATAAVPNPTAGLLSAFSSFGLAADLSLKPDIAAPGGLIRSTWPVERGSYITLSGTSMAAPHVAGAVALYLQAHPRTKARDVRTALQNSADPVPWSLAPALGVPDYVSRQGAGLLDIDDAILATTTITPGKVSLGDSVTSDPSRHRRDDEDDDVGGGPRTLTIENDGSQAVRYALSKVDALAVAGREFGAEHPEAGPSTVEFEQHGEPVTSITVRAHRKEKLEVTITPSPGLSEGAIYGGYLVFTPDVGDAPLRVTYAGYKGDYQKVDATTATTRGFPWLARRTSIAIDPAGHIRPVYTKQDVGAVFTLTPTTLNTIPAGSITRASTDSPFVLMHMNNHARHIGIEVFRARSHASLGTVFEQDFVPRNSVESPLAQQWTLATAMPLDGTARSRNRRHRLADGDYYVVVTVERALAARSTPTETWTSPTFRIERNP